MRHSRLRFAPITLLMALSLSCECAATPQLSGEWESTIALEPATGTWLIEADFTLGCALADWTAELRTLVENDDWKNQDFQLTGSICSVDIESDLRFEPYKNRFRDWITEFEWETDQLTLTLTTKLTRTTDWLILELEREWENVEMDASFRLRAPTGVCGLLFYDASADVAFDWCGIETDLEVSFDDDGFDELVVEFKEMVHPRIPWVTFDLEITRTLVTTTIELTPELALTTPWCEARVDLEFDGTLPSAPNLLPFTIDEVQLELEAADWDIEATAYGNPANWIDDLYWLEVEAGTELDLAPCGELAIEFGTLWTQTQLGKATGEATYEPTEALALTLSATIDCVARRIEVLEAAVTIAW